MIIILKFQEKIYLFMLFLLENEKRFEIRVKFKLLINEGKGENNTQTLKNF